MGEQENREAAKRFWKALENADFDAAGSELHHDMVEDYPQSGERILGVANWLELVRNYPGFPAVTIKGISGRDDLWVAEAAFDYAKDGSPPWQVCEVMEFRDGKIANIRAYFGAPFEAAEWDPSGSRGRPTRRSERSPGGRSPGPSLPRWSARLARPGPRTGPGRRLP
jgi:limonene-1,2-epoxide hydrolase